MTNFCGNKILDLRLAIYCLAHTSRLLTSYHVKYISALVIAFANQWSTGDFSKPSLVQNA